MTHREGLSLTCACPVFACLRKYNIYKFMNDAELQELAGLLKALGEINRLSLVCRLCECATPQKAMCLYECCNVDASGVSRHLKHLSQEGIVSVQQQGRERSYSLNRAYVAERLRSLADKIDSIKEEP